MERGLSAPAQRNARVRKDGTIGCYAPRCRQPAEDYVQSMPTAGPYPACEAHAQRFCDTAFNYDGAWARRWPVHDGPAGGGFA